MIEKFNETSAKIGYPPIGIFAWQPPSQSEVGDGVLCTVYTSVAFVSMYGAEARKKWQPHWGWCEKSRDQSGDTAKKGTEKTGQN